MTMMTTENTTIRKPWPSSALRAQGCVLDFEGGLGIVVQAAHQIMVHFIVHTGGGRYDGLVEQLGGAPTKAVGFGLGLERLILLLLTLGKVSPKPNVDVYVVGSGEGAEMRMLEVSNFLRQSLPGVAVMNHCGGGNFKKQFKKGDKYYELCYN